MKYVNKNYAITHPIQEYMTNKIIRSYKPTTLLGEVSSKNPYNCLHFVGSGIEFHNHGIETYCDYNLIDKYEDFISVSSEGDLQSIIESFSKNHPIIEQTFKTLKDKLVFSKIISEIRGFGISRLRDDTDSIAYIIYFKDRGKFLLVVDGYDYVIKLDRHNLCNYNYYSRLSSSTIVTKFLIKIKALRNILYKSEGEDIAKVLIRVYNEQCAL